MRLFDHFEAYSHDLGKIGWIVLVVAAAIICLAYFGSVTPKFLGPS